MKDIKCKLASAMLSGCLVFSAWSLPISSIVMADETVTEVTSTSSEDENREKIYAFVDRLYSVCLGREADEGGKSYWADELLGRRATGVSCAIGFIFSEEFMNKNCTNEEFVGFMYDAFFGREVADAEIEYWVSEMNSGKSRTEVFTGFANSAEFAAICDDYGVVRGDYLPDYDINQTVQVNLFIDRMYTNVLERTCDAAGMTYWTQELLGQRLTGAGVAEGFIFSEEFANRGLCNECYIKVLYNAFMGREYDQEGLDYWVGQLNSGASRETAFNGYVASQEFTNICASYGILRGEPNAQGNTVVTDNDNCPLDVPAEPTEAPAEPTAAPVEPTVAPTAAPTYEYDIGDKITFGNYAGEDISWIILDRADGNYLVISEYGLEIYDCLHGTFDTWENSAVRSWLNDGFINAAFTPAEQAHILTTTVVAEDNPYSDEDPGNDTEDNIFLLNVQEAELYFPTDESRICYATQHAMDNGAWCYYSDTNACWWWLRSPGDIWGPFANIVSDGRVNSSYGDIHDYDKFVVRPAMWIDLTDVDVSPDPTVIPDVTNTPTPTSAPAPTTPDYEVGDTVNLGNYGGEAITWVVADKDEDGNLMLLSVNAIDGKPFNDVNESTSWEDCSLRAWLNGEFFQTAFDASEQNLILTTTVESESTYWDEDNDTWVPFNDTEDKVYILSISEVRQYLGEANEDSDNEEYICLATEYAISNGLVVFESDNPELEYMTNACFWWLRNIGEFTNQECFMYYTFVNDIGLEVNNLNGVRPVIWVNFGDTAD